MSSHNSEEWRRPLNLDIDVAHPADYAHRYRMQTSDNSETCRIKEIFGLAVFTLSVLSFALGIYLL